MTSADDLDDDFLVETVSVGDKDEEGVDAVPVQDTKETSQRLKKHPQKSADDLEDDFYLAGEELSPPKKKDKKRKQTSDEVGQQAPKSKKLRCVNLDSYDMHDPSSLGFTGEKTTETLMDFLKLLYPDKSKRMLADANRNPFHLLIVCQSAERVIEVMKVLKTVLPNIKMVKLFSRHIKLQEHVEMISSGKYVMGVGTPNRILKLIQETTASDWNLLQNAVLDTSFKDKKNFSLLDLFACKDDLETLLQDLSERPCKLWTF